MTDHFELTNLQILNSLQGLSELNKLKLPAKTAYAVAKLAKKVGGLHETLSTVINELYQKWAEKDEDGKVKIMDDKGSITIPRENVPSLNKEYEELMKVTNQVSGKKLSIADLGDITLAPEVLMHLDWLLED